MGADPAPLGALVVPMAAGKTTYALSDPRAGDVDWVQDEYFTAQQKTELKRLRRVGIDTGDWRPYTEQWRPGLLAWVAGGHAGRVGLMHSLPDALEAGLAVLGVVLPPIDRHYEQLFRREAEGEPPAVPPDMLALWQSNRRSVIRTTTEHPDLPVFETVEAAVTHFIGAKK